MLTRDEVEKAMPPTLKSSVTQNLVDTINNVSNDPILAEQIRNNFISYTRVLQEGKFKTEDYLSAVMYVSYKLMGYTNQDAYFRTFPQRHAALLAKGLQAKDIAAYVSAYHKGKLVNLIMEQCLVPVHVLNHDIYQKAINVQADLMVNAQSEKVRSDAANSILTHLAKPKETVANNLNVGISVDSGMGELKDMLTQLAEKQIKTIENGVTAKEIAAQRLIPLVENTQESVGIPNGSN